MLVFSTVWELGMLFFLYPVKMTTAMPGLLANESFVTIRKNTKTGLIPPPLSLVMILPRISRILIRS